MTWVLILYLTYYDPITKAQQGTEVRQYNTFSNLEECIRVGQKLSNESGMTRDLVIRYSCRPTDAPNFK